MSTPSPLPIQPCTYRQTWVNLTPHPLALFLSSIEPASSSSGSTLPPRGYLLTAGGEYTLAWRHAPGVAERERKTSGYLRFWSRASTGLPGSGGTFGVKLEERFPPSPPGSAGKEELKEQARVLIYNGSPSGNPLAWQDVTPAFSAAGRKYGFGVMREEGSMRVTITSEGAEGAGDGQAAEGAVKERTVRITIE